MSYDYYQLIWDNQQKIGELEVARQSLEGCQTRFQTILRTMKCEDYSKGGFEGGKANEFHNKIMDEIGVVEQKLSDYYQEQIEQINAQIRDFKTWIGRYQESLKQQEGDSYE